MRKWMICAAMMMAAWVVSPNAFAQQNMKAVKQKASGQTVKAPDRPLDVKTRQSAVSSDVKQKKASVTTPAKSVPVQTKVQPKSASVATVKPAEVPVKNKEVFSKQNTSASKRSVTLKKQEKHRKMPKAKAVSGTISVKKGSAFDGRNVKVKNRTTPKKSETKK